MVRACSRGGGSGGDDSGEEDGGAIPQHRTQTQLVKRARAVAVWEKLQSAVGSKPALSAKVGAAIAKKLAAASGRQLELKGAEGRSGPGSLTILCQPIDSSLVGGYQGGAAGAPGGDLVSVRCWDIRALLYFEHGWLDTLHSIMDVTGMGRTYF